MLTRHSVICAFAEIIYGRAATPDEVESLLLETEHVGQQIGPKWLTPEATKRVLARTKPKAGALAEFKRNGSHDYCCNDS